MSSTTDKERFMIETALALVNIANRKEFEHIAPDEKVELIKQVSDYLLVQDHINIL